MSQTTLDSLTREVTEQTGRLESPAEAAAVLESLGLGDDAARDLGYPDIFLLGLEVFEHQSSDEAIGVRRREVESIYRAEELERRKPSALGGFLPRFFAKGFTFGAPMAMMLFSVLVLLYSLWAYFFFEVPRGTAIAVGTVGSYLVTAGFMQAIGRRGLMYLRQDMQVLTFKVSMLLVGLGVAAVILSGLLIWAFLALFPVIAPGEVPIAVLYFVTLSLLWLGLSIVYMLQQEIWFSIAVALGIGMVYYMREFRRESIVVSHQAGILTAALFGLAIGTLLLWLREARLRRNRKQPIAGRLPRFSVIVYSVFPYFIYGLTYFLFLFTDRILAWTGKAPFRRYFVWFQSDYEVGLNWALLSLLLSFGILEFTVYRLGELIPYLSQRFTLLDIPRFTGNVLAFYRRAVSVYIVSAVAGVVIAFVAVQALAPRVPLIESLLTRTSVIVFFVASIAYLFVVWSLLNNVFLFSFSRPLYALRAVALALVVDLVVGFVLSRVFIYWAAVFGLLAGGIVLWLISSHYTMKVLRDMDFYAYSAF